MLVCKFARQEPGRLKKIYCDVTGSLCGHVHLCQLSMKWKQTNAAEKCPLAFPKEEPAPEEEPKKKKVRIRKNAEK